MKATIRRALAGLVGSTLLAGLAFAQEESVRGGTLIMAVQGTPRHLNPAVQSGIATGEPGTQLFAAPLRYDEDWTPQPYLAESWEVSEDGLTVTLHLVKEAVFHDGEPITSEDVAFSIQTVKEGHPFKAMFEPVETVETPDEHTAVIRLSQPHPALLLAMSSQLLPIIPKHVYGDGQDVMTHPRNSEDVVGSGPFKLVEFVADQHIILERHENFFIEDRPYLDRIVMRIIKDPSARTIALETGEAQLSGFESIARDIKRMQQNDQLVVTSEGYGAVGPIAWLAFNTENEYLSDVRVRQSISHAVDKNFLLTESHQYRERQCARHGVLIWWQERWLKVRAISEALTPLAAAASRRHDDFSEEPPLLHRPRRLLGVVQRELGRNNRGERRSRPEPDLRSAAPKKQVGRGCFGG